MRRSHSISPPTGMQYEVRLASIEEAFDSMKHVFDQVAVRAHEIFESEGRKIGSDLRNWYRAEAELLAPVRVDVYDSKDVLTLRAEVPGFAAGELQVGVSPNRFAIAGARNRPMETGNKRRASARVVSTYLFHSGALPQEIEVETARATLGDGVLRVQLAKATAAPASAAGATAAR